MSALVIAEHDNNSIKPATLNVVTAATRCGGDVHVLVVGHNAGAAAAEAARIAGVAKVIHADEAGLAHGLAENVTAQVLAPDEIRAIRLNEHISQPVFARYLNVSKNLVSDWERGIKKPGGPALRLLTVIRKKGLGVIA